MCTQHIRFIVFSCLLLASASPIVQAESVANASVVLSMCQAIATKTAKILQQQQRDYAIAYWSKASNIRSYVDIWSNRVKAQGGDPNGVDNCVRKFNQTVYKYREYLSDELLKKDNTRMAEIDGQMFEILAKDMKQETMEKYVNIVKGISEVALNTSKNEGDTLLKSTVNLLKAMYLITANCLRNMMIGVHPMMDFNKH